MPGEKTDSWRACWREMASGEAEVEGKGGMNLLVLVMGAMGLGFISSQCFTLAVKSFDTPVSSSSGLLSTLKKQTEDIKYVSKIGELMWQKKKMLTAIICFYMYFM